MTIAKVVKIIHLVYTTITDIWIKEEFKNCHISLVTRRDA